MTATSPRVLDTAADDQVLAEFMAPYHGRTRANVTYYVRWWREWLTGRGVGLLEARAYDAEQWVRHLVEDRGLHTNTARSYLSGPMTLYRWCEATGRLEADPMRHVRRPADTRRTMRPWLTGPELRRLLDVAAGMDPDTDLICHLLALNGPRVGELVRVDVRDIAQHGDLTTIRLQRTKTAASDLVSLSAPTLRALTRVLEIRPRYGPLLISEHTGQRMSPWGVRRRLRAALATAGLNTAIAPHDLRATFITLSRVAGVPGVDVAISAGIVTVSMLLRYDQMVAAVERNATHGLTTWLNALPDTTPTEERP
ncbi:tyrosine-type recombinase/integrase [Cellulomonas sp. P4]|uniref:tyrosine-type recombinase/integrase n=1 Tax=Cellulomonas sp. P4 TaxID=3142533 RepID=UPI0031BAF5C5